MRKVIIVSAALFFCLSTSSYAFNFGSLSEGVKAIGNSVDGAAGDVLKATGDVLAKEQAQEEEAKRQAKLKAETEKREAERKAEQERRKAEQERRVAEQRKREAERKARLKAEAEKREAERKAEQDRRVAEQKKRGVEEAKKAPVGHAKAEKTTSEQEKREVVQKERTVKKITPTAREKSIIDKILYRYMEIVDGGMLSAASTPMTITLYKRSKEAFEGSYEELKRINPELALSPFEVRNTDFVSLVEDGKRRIAENDKFLGVTPNSSARDQMETAFRAAKRGMKCIEAKDCPDYSFEALEKEYKRYVFYKDSAIEEDKKTIAYYSDTIKHYDTNFVPAYKAEKQKVDAKLKAQREAEAKRKEEEYKRKERERLERQQAMENRAAELGFSNGYVEGIRNLISKITYGELSPSDAGKLLVFKRSVDCFKVQSLDGDYVYYVFDDGHFNYTHIGVVREDNQYYGEGAYLTADHFHFIGFMDAVTVLGARKQIPIFEAVTGD